MDCIFETERLCFRMWKEEDKKEFAEMNSDPIVMEYFPKILTEEESNQLYDRINNHLLNNNYGLWAVELKETHQFIGFIGLAVPNFLLAFR